MKASTLKKLSTSLMAVSLVACSSAPLRKHETRTDHSEAWNIAMAGGLHTDIKDTKIPKDVADHTLYNTAFMATGFMANGLTGFGFNSLLLLTSSKSQGGRNSILAWIPQSEAKTAEEAQKMMMDNLQLSFKSMLKGFDAELLDDDGYGNKRENGDEYTPWDTSTSFSDALFALYPITKKEWGCLDESRGYCNFQIRLHPPRLVETPDFIDSNEKYSWLFSGNPSKDYSRIEMPVGLSYPGDDIYTSLSKNLPSNVYLYQAVKGVKLKTYAENRAVNPIPYILNKGEPKLFITVED